MLSDRLCFLRMPAILPEFPTCPRQPVQLCITLETVAKLFSGNFSTALSDAKKQAWTAEISISPHVDRHNGDPQPGQARHNGITRCDHLTLGCSILEHRSHLRPEKSPKHSWKTPWRNLGLVSSELLLELILSGGNTLFSIYDLLLSVVPKQGFPSLVILGGYHHHLYNDQYQWWRMPTLAAAAEASLTSMLWNDLHGIESSLHGALSSPLAGSFL